VRVLPAQLFDAVLCLVELGYALVPLDKITDLDLQGLSIVLGHLDDVYLIKEGGLALLVEVRSYLLDRGFNCGVDRGDLVP
jgi:uncharacterized membrane protein YkvA (DUF1232 family)